MFKIVLSWPFHVIGLRNIEKLVCDEYKWGKVDNLGEDESEIAKNFFLSFDESCRLGDPGFFSHHLLGLYDFALFLLIGFLALILNPKQPCFLPNKLKFLNNIAEDPFFLSILFRRLLTHAQTVFIIGV